MSTQLREYRPSALDRMVQGDTMTPAEIEEIRRETGPEKIVVVQEARKPWGWWIGGFLGFCFMVFSFASWLVASLVEKSEQASIRMQEMATEQAAKAHELAMLSIDAAEKSAQIQTYASSATPEMSLIFIMGLIGVGFVVRGMCKVIMK